MTQDDDRPWMAEIGEFKNDLHYICQQLRRMADADRGYEYMCRMPLPVRGIWLAAAIMLEHLDGERKREQKRGETTNGHE